MGMGRTMNLVRGILLFLGCTVAALSGAAESKFTDLEGNPGLRSASALVLPVVRIDEKTIGDGTPGPLFRRLRSLYVEQALATLS